MPPKAAGEADFTVKGVIIGDPSVGKTSLLHRYTSNEWNPHYIATIGVDVSIFYIEREGRQVKVQVWDTAGQEKFRAIAQSYYRNAHGVMLVFDLTNRESFEHITTWLSDFEVFSASKGQGIPLLLVGNKADRTEQIVVTQRAAEAFAEKVQCKYVQCSALSGAGVEDAFKLLANSCLDFRLKTIGTEQASTTTQPIRPINAPAPKPGGKKCSC